ncbi:hypothetical protein [Roseateles sp. PN1]|uniref:hypothetical protein n=1 Tax=Roseateles sp. PN1 TaxID=3137372 RepID=UPI00313A1EC0
MIEQSNKAISPNIVGIAQRIKDAGTTSRKLGAEKRAKALSWVYRWGWSSPTLLDDYVSPGRRGLVKGLVDQGYLESYPNPAGGGDKGNPRQAICLTEKGQSFVEGYLDTRHDLLPQKRADDIPWRQLRHDYLVQQASVGAIKGGRIKDALSPKQVSQQSRAGIKQPDAIWILDTDQRAAIELELTRKKPGLEESQTVAALVSSISTEPGDGKVDMVIIVSHSNAILDSYKELLKPNRTLRLYTRDSQRKWVESGNMTIPASISQKFIYHKIDL